MKALNRLIRSIVIVGGLLFGAQAYAQIPTTDIAALAQRLLQIQNGIDQLESMKSQITALTGNSNVGQILNNPSLRSYLPDQWQSIYSQVQSGQLQGLSSATQQIIASENLGNAATPGQQRYNNTLATNKAMAQAAYDASITRLQNIQALMQQSDATTSASDKADLNNRLQAELAMVQNEQTRLNLMGKLQDAETALAEQQRQSETKNALLGISN